MFAKSFVRGIPVLAVTAALTPVVTITAALRAYDAPPVPLALNETRITIAGTSNVHDYTATTTAARLTRVNLAAPASGATIWEEIVKPGALEAFEVTVAATTLSSPREGVDKNMYKALKTTRHPDIVFRLSRLAPGTATGAFKAIGLMTVAGVEREITFDIKTTQRDSTLAVMGEARLLMTDFGIAPPKALLGMLKTDPKVTVTFETLLTVPLN